MDYETLRDLRLSKGLYQREIADKTGISLTFYSLIESGFRIPSLRCANKISIIMGISLDDFYSLIIENINRV